MRTEVEDGHHLVLFYPSKKGSSSQQGFWLMEQLIFYSRDIDSYTLLWATWYQLAESVDIDLKAKRLLLEINCYSSTPANK